MGLGRGGIRTLTPVGTWRGVYFSEELKNAAKHGYKFTIHRGYLFNRENIFKKYVSTLYSIKKNSAKKSAQYLISKLLLNTLYGRFGMSPDLSTSLFLSNAESIELANDPSKYVSNDDDFGNNIHLVTFKEERKPADPLKEDDSGFLNISIPVAASITSFSRIRMAQYLVEYADIILYIDTDGIKTSAPIDSKYVGGDLGQMEFEGHFEQGVFIAPKLYALTMDGYSNETDLEKRKKLSSVTIKGLKLDSSGHSPVSFDQVLELLQKDHRIGVHQDVWHRNLVLGNIKVVDSLYSMMVTDNKRELIYDTSDKFVDTKPYTLIDGEFTINKSNKS